MYGPGEHPSKLVASVCSSMLKNEIAECSDGTQKRDYMHVEDVASAFVKLLDSEVQGPVNIASGDAVAIKDIVLKIAASLNKLDQVKFGAIPAPKNQPDLIIADISRLKNEVNWAPKYNLDEGIADSLHYWTEQLKKT